MPIVSKTTAGEKETVNVTFVDGEEGADKLVEELTKKFGGKSTAKKDTETKKSTAKK